MLAIKRIDIIMEILRESGSAMVSDLSRRLDVSEETIRRDFEKLEKEKKIRRVHGGAYLINDASREMPSEVPSSLRKQFFVEEKKRMARSCVGFVADWDSIMLDSSTTSLFIAREIGIARKNVTLVTNSLDIAVEMADNEFVRTIVIGGVLRRATRSFNGGVSCESMDRYFANKAFVSCAALDLAFGITDQDENQGKLRELMLARSHTRFLVADNTKFGKVTGHAIAGLDQVDYIVTDAPLPEEWIDALERKAVKLIVAEK